MTNKIHYLFQAGLTCLILSLTACGTTGPSASSTTVTAAATSSTGDTKTASDLLNAIAEGIEDATASYVTTPAAPASAALTTASF